MIEKFTLTIKNSAPTEELLMIVLNPNHIAQEAGTIYKDFFPVIWQVLDFASSNEHGCHVVTFDSKLDVVLQGKTRDNVFYAQARLPVTEEQKSFEIAKLNGGGYHLTCIKITNEPYVASIYNPFEGQFDVGLGDDYGESYLTMELPAGERRTFGFEAEFAIVPLFNTVKVQSKLTNGAAQRPWFSFKLSNLTMEDISFSFDGSAIVDQVGISSITSYRADQEIFGISSINTSTDRNVAYL
ncbi:hypothetical protein EC973_004147 [Apophysomyces ossiformis]|uniref:Uncharacterized protein n=1 Tax=Apophysomyces ossiformis TaxID=679940 RepID=A0A8H7BH59_9FUNG|nr:hypothetical protein EC973_004147 [Apophysomyces ossiformis]